MSLARYNLLIDLNGTCHIADNPTPGAVQAIEKLRAAQQRQPNRIDIRFCTLYHRSSEGAALLMGPGAFVAALEAASLCCASSTTVCGKPSQALLQECISGMVSANQVISDYTNIIIGDDSDADLGKGTLHNLVYVGC
uniref:Uncharacterized protein n=1 Tax=Melanopsichium pennsylvanicum 4 TaxID=1398559 RepID=A0A077R9Z6_9BASI|nr:conserved hypothetical protein [Melanopsichium pennsylvanicum 4]